MGLGQLIERKKDDDDYVMLLVTAKAKPSRGEEGKSDKKESRIFKQFIVDFPFELTGLRSDMFVLSILISHSLGNVLSNPLLPYIGCKTNDMDDYVAKIKIDQFEHGSLNCYGNRFDTARAAVDYKAINNMKAPFHHTSDSNVLEFSYADETKCVDVLPLSRSKNLDGKDTFHLNHSLLTDLDGPLKNIVVKPERFATERAIKAAQFMMARMVPALISDANDKRLLAADAETAKARKSELKVEAELCERGAKEYSMLQGFKNFDSYTHEEKKEHEKTIRDCRPISWSTLDKIMKENPLRTDLSLIDFGVEIPIWINELSIQFS
jgi:hypothetical protein